MAYFNKLYPIKYKEVFISKKLFLNEGRIWITGSAEGYPDLFLRATISEVDPEFITLDVANSDAEICVPLDAVVYSSEIPSGLLS
jgi:hypothetical protein